MLFKVNKLTNYFRALLAIVLLGFISSCSKGFKEDLPDSSQPNFESNESDKNLQTKEYNLQVKNPKNSVIRISNNGNNIISFFIELNGNKFFNDIDDIINEIKSMKDEYPGEKIVRKVWRFTRDNSYHNTPLTEDAWFHNPMLFFNSLGFGFCDDVAMVNCNIWSHLGYKARVWGLLGHSVSEVYVDGRWELYDSDLGVYYHNEKSQIAGVEELHLNPRLISNPINPIIKDINLAKSKDAYSLKTADAYYSNNNYYVDFSIDVGSILTKFYLSPGTYLEFPGKMESSLYTGIVGNNKVNVPDYANLRIYIAYSSNGLLPYPFVIQSVHGNGYLSFNGKKYDIGSKEMNNLLASYNSFIYPLDFSSEESLEVIYLINPIRFKLLENNKLILKGTNISQLNVEIVPIHTD